MKSLLLLVLFSAAITVNAGTNVSAATEAARLRSVFDFKDYYNNDQDITGGVCNSICLNALISDYNNVYGTSLSTRQVVSEINRDSACLVTIEPGQGTNGYNFQKITYAKRSINCIARAIVRMRAK